MTLVISKGLTLDNGTRAAAIAGVSPTLDYRFAREKREIETVSLTDKLTYTGGNGTFVGSDGFIQPATTNVPRFDHDPLSRQSLGLLSEVERTNLLLWSQDYNQTAWSKNSSVIVATGIASPVLGVNYQKIESTAVNSVVGITGSSVSAASEPRSVSFFAKPLDNISQILLVVQGPDARVIVDLVDGSFVTNAAGTGAVASKEGDRFKVSFPALVSATNVRFFAKNANDSNVTSTFTTIAIGEGFLLTGVQMESASTPSTYIPTTTAAVTRTADSAVIDGTGVITGTYTLVEKPAGCAVVSGTNINLQPGFTAERVMVFPAALDAGQITAIRGAM